MLDGELIKAVRTRFANALWYVGVSILLAHDKARGEPQFERIFSAGIDAIEYDYTPDFRWQSEAGAPCEKTYGEVKAVVAFMRAVGAGYIRSEERNGIVLVEGWREPPEEDPFPKWDKSKLM